MSADSLGANDLLFPDHQLQLQEEQHHVLRQEQQKQQLIVKRETPTPTGDSDLLQQVMDEIKVEATSVDVNDWAMPDQSAVVPSDGQHENGLKTILADYSDLVFSEGPRQLDPIASEDNNSSVGSPPDNNVANMDTTQNLIDEMEDFLSYHESKDDVK